MLDSYRLRMNALGGYEGESRRRNSQKIMDASWMRDAATKPVYVKHTKMNENILFMLEYSELIGLVHLLSVLLLSNGPIKPKEKVATKKETKNDVPVWFNKDNEIDEANSEDVEELENLLNELV